MVLAKYEEHLFTNSSSFIGKHKFTYFKPAKSTIRWTVLHFVSPLTNSCIKPSAYITFLEEGNATAPYLSCHVAQIYNFYFNFNWFSTL